MKLNKILLATVASLSIVSFAQAAGGSGVVNFKGSIVDAPCSIAPESLNQTVDLGAVSNVALAQQGKSIPRDFSIKLEQCDFTNGKNKVTTTFTGVSSPEDTDLLAINGTASGAGIGMTTYNKNVIKLGQATDEFTLTGPSPELQFQAFLQGGKANAVIVPGEFTSTVNFELNYN